VRAQKGAIWNSRVSFGGMIAAAVVLARLSFGHVGMGIMGRARHGSVVN